MEKILPTNKWILVKPHEKKNKSAGGIHLPDSALDKILRGTVVQIDPCIEDIKIPNPCDIYYHQDVGIDFIIDGDKHHWIKCTQIMGFIDIPKEKL
jgi:co-chaperonin GroES (HSP10)